MRWITSQWSTNPYYALVIAVIACGGVPKGTFQSSLSDNDLRQLLVTTTNSNIC